MMIQGVAEPEGVLEWGEVYDQALQGENAPVQL